MRAIINQEMAKPSLYDGAVKMEEIASDPEIQKGRKGKKNQKAEVEIGMDEEEE